MKFRECLLSEPSVFPLAIYKHRDKIYRQRILPVILYGCETWSLTLREEHRLRVFKNRVLLDRRGWKGQETGEIA